MPGKFIVIEGIDGAGGETQTKLLINFLEHIGKNVLFVTYPDYSGAIGRIIHGFLHKEYNFPADVQFALYATDMVKDKQKILNALKENRIVVANRYITTTLAYQSAGGFPVERGLAFARNFELPKPDLVIYLDIDAETSMLRKTGEKNVLDKFESDKKFLGKVRAQYLKLARKKVFAREWKIINGKRHIEDVAEDIQKIVSQTLKL